MNKKRYVLLASIPLLILAACGEEKEPIKPEKEPVEVAKEKKEDKKQQVGFTVAEISNLFTDNRFLTDYEKELEKAGYSKPTKDILMSKSPDLEKRGRIYEVKDGYAVLEYDKATGSVLAVTSYESLEQIELQEMKTKAYLKETELLEEKDETKRKALQKEIDEMWNDITKRENGELSPDTEIKEGSDGYEGNANAESNDLTIVN